MLRNWIIAFTAISLAICGGALVFYFTYWPQMMDRNAALIAHIVEQGLAEYHEEHDAYPQGSSREIIATLLGNNPTGKSYLRPEFTKFLSLEGNVLDSWKQPFQFDRSRDGTIHLRSAGRNGKFHDDDDVTSDFLK